MERDAILGLMRQVMERQGRSLPLAEDAMLRDAGFRSLDFSELALRIEQQLGRELNFDAGRLRRIQTVGDVLDFFHGASAG